MMRKLVGTNIVGKMVAVVLLLPWSQLQLFFEEKRQKGTVRLGLKYKKEEHPEVHLTCFESLEFLKSLNILNLKIC